MSDTRDENQPAPKPGTVDVVYAIIEDYGIADVDTGKPWGMIRELLIQRRAFGVEKYGLPLEAHNGRDSLRDLEEEIVDAFQYSEQALIESRKISRVRALAMTEMLEHIKINIDSMLED